MSILRAAAIVVVVAAPFAAPRADACSFVFRTIDSLRFSVVDGATVPRNLVLFSEGIDEDDGSSWWLVGGEGVEPVRLEMEITSGDSSRFTPSTTLLPSTTYALRWSPTPSAPVGDADPNQPDVTITTTADDDVVAPAAPTVTSETQAIWSDPLSTCGWRDGATWARFFVTPDDDAIAAYQLVVEDGVVDQEHPSFGSRDDNGDFFLAEQATEGGSRSYRVVAVDHAGNVSEPTTVDVNLGCPGSCSSADLTGVGSLGAVLLLLRRRRR